MGSKFRKTFTFAGKKYYASGKTSEEAAVNADRKLRELQSGYKRESNITLEEWGKRWFEIYKSANVGTGGKINIISLYKKIKKTSFYKTPINKITTISLQNFINENLSTSSYSYASTYIITLKDVFERAVDNELLSKNPAKNLKVPKTCIPKLNRRAISEEERALILELCPQHGIGIVVMLCLRAGLRPGEATALQWKHVDFDKKLLYIRQAIKAATKKIGSPKNERSVRDVPIPEDLYVFLKERKGPPDEFLFRPNAPRERVSYTTERFAKFRHALIEAGKLREPPVFFPPDVTLYFLRHTYCTDLRMLPIIMTANVMGHSIQMTEKIYSHTTKMEKQLILDVLDTQSEE